MSLETVPLLNMSSSDTQQQIQELTAAVSQLGKSVSQLVQVSTANSHQIVATDTRLDKLTTAVDALVVEFIRPAIQQTNANREAIAQLIEQSQHYVEWLDEDRRDINTLRQETSQQIQALIEQANADRTAANERFEAMQAEIRQNQRLILSQGERLDTAISENKTLLTEVLSLSRRVAAVEETVEGNAA